MRKTAKKKHPNTATPPTGIKEEPYCILSFRHQHHGDSIQQDADEQTRQTDKKDGKEEVKHETPEPLERLPTATRNAFSAPIEGVVTGDEEYGME